MFRRSRQPKVIPFLAEDFYSDEDPNGGKTTSPPPDSSEFAVGVPARSIFSGVIVTDLIKNSHLFTPQMEAWANQAFVLRLESAERFRNLMRVWWETNKAAFARGDYQAVVPVEERQSKLTTPSAPAPKPKAPTSDLPKDAPNSTEPPAPIARSPVALSEGPKWEWPWAIGIAAICAVAWLIWKRRS